MLYQKFKAESSPPASDGFTIVELLLTVAIIILLLAIMLPALSQAREVARAAVCATNQHQIGLAWKVYLANHDDNFPKWGSNIWWFYGGKEPCVATKVEAPDDDSGVSPVLPFRPLNPYVKLRDTSQSWAELFHCPGDRPLTDGQGRPAVTHGYSAYEYFGNSYVVNWFLLLPYSYDYENDVYVPHFGENFRLTDVQLPYHRVMLTGDCQWYYSNNGAKWNAQFHTPDHWMNLLFLDGHVSFTQVFYYEDVNNGAPATYSLWPYSWDPDQEEE